MDLYKVIDGEGIPLLMIHGIISDSTFFEGTTAFLKDKYQVITYDRRGYGKSCVDEDSNFSIHTQAEDAARVLQESCSTPAIIFGNSAGGLIAIDLAINHPELVRSMILLEPSLGYDDDSRRMLSDWNQDLNKLVEARKIKRALPMFSDVIGGKSDSMSSSSLAEMKMIYHNLEAFMYNELNEVQNHLPEIDACRELKMPIAVAVTTDGKDSIFGVSSIRGAEIIGWPTVYFPGRHNVAKDMPEEFANTLDGVIEELRL